MPPTLRRLAYFENALLPTATIDPALWASPIDLANQHPIYFKTLIKNHQFLAVELQALLNQLAIYLKKNAYQKDFDSTIQEALIITCLLENIYSTHLHRPLHVLRLSREKNILCQLQSLTIDDKLTPLGHSLAAYFSVTDYIRDTTIIVNWPRLFILRSRRLFFALNPLLNGSAYNDAVLTLDAWTVSPIAYLSWMFFIPRLGSNLFLTAKYTLPSSCLSPQAASLGWQTRLSIQLQERWFEIANDLGWLTAGLLNCFVFIGQLAPINIYLAIGLQLYDVILAQLRMIVEVRRLNTLTTQYNAMLDNPNLDVSEKTAIIEHLKHLQLRIEFEQNRLYLNVVNTRVLLLAICLALPAIVFHPVIPFIGALISVLVTLCMYQRTQLIEQQNPISTLTALDVSKVIPKKEQISDNQFSFFKPRTADNPSAKCATHQKVENNVISAPGLK